MLEQAVLLERAQHLGHAPGLRAGAAPVLGARQAGDEHAQPGRVVQAEAPESLVERASVEDFGEARGVSFYGNVRST